MRLDLGIEGLELRHETPLGWMRVDVHDSESSPGRKEPVNQRRPVVGEPTGRDDDAPRNRSAKDRWTRVLDALAQAWAFVAGQSSYTGRTTIGRRHGRCDVSAGQSSNDQQPIRHEQL